MSLRHNPPHVPLDLQAPFIELKLVSLPLSQPSSCIFLENHCSFVDFDIPESLLALYHSPVLLDEKRCFLLLEVTFDFLLGSQVGFGPHNLKICLAKECAGNLVTLELISTLGNQDPFVLEVILNIKFVKV